MGCLCVKFFGARPMVEEKDDDDVPKQYSWDKRDRVNPEDYMVDGASNTTIYRLPNSVKGQQFIIQNCQGCNIMVFDHMASVTIDDCTDCCIFLGPIKSSVFIRDCSNCRVMVACQQFRTRDCKHLEIFLCCATQPIIESSTGMKFASFQYFYSELEDQFNKADLSVYNNNWSDIHDFTPVPDEKNFSYLPQDSPVECFIPPLVQEFNVEGLSVEKSKSLVPHTLGKRRKQHEECCLVVFFCHRQTSNDEVRPFITKMAEENTDCELVQSKEVTLQLTEAESLFGTNIYNALVALGPVVGLEYNGVNCCSRCQSLANTQQSNKIFVSSDATAAKKHIENFYNVAQMHLAI